MTEPGLESTTSGLEIHWAKHYYIAITKYEWEKYNIQTAFIKKKSYDFFFNFHQRIFSLYSTSW